MEHAVARQVDGKWLPGTSGNPGGRTAVLEEVRSLARQHTKMAITQLAEIAKDGKKEQARVMACIALLDRGWGKPAQAVEMTKKGILRFVLSQPRGTDPLAQAREPAALPPPISPEAAALEAEIIDLPPKP
jgi:hypothetical protein